MAKALAVVALISLIVILGSAVASSWTHDPAKEDFIKLTQLLLSWQIIAGGLVAGGAKTFETEIKGALRRAFSGPSEKADGAIHEEFQQVADRAFDED